MEVLHQIIDYIARTNLFNFVIFMAIIIFLVKKLNVSQKLEEARGSVDAAINESEETKEVSEGKLSETKESFSHLEEKVNEIIQISVNNAKIVGEKIIDESDKAANLIKENAEKLIENDRILLKNDLLRRAANASVETAKDRIINELNNNGALHDKFIEESITAIEGMEL